MDANSTAPLAMIAIGAQSSRSHSSAVGPKRAFGSGSLLSAMGWLAAGQLQGLNGQKAALRVPAKPRCARFPRVTMEG